MKRAAFLSYALLIALLLPACDGDASTPPPPPPVTPTPDPSSGVGIIGPAGGSVSLPSVAELTFGAGSVAAGTRVEITEVPAPTSNADFVTASEFAAASNISSRAVEVLVVGSQPVGSVQVKLFVPSSYISGLPAGHKIRVLALSINESGMETASATYEILPVTVNSSDSSITFSAGSVFFAFKSGTNSIARFVIASSL